MWICVCLCVCLTHQESRLSHGFPVWGGVPIFLKFSSPDAKIGIRAQLVSLLHKQICNWRTRFQPTFLFLLAPQTLWMVLLSGSIDGWEKFCRWEDWLCVSPSPQRSRCQDGIRCARTFLREMFVRGKGQGLEKVGRATRLWCWHEPCEESREESLRLQCSSKKVLPRLSGMVLLSISAALHPWLGSSQWKACSCSNVMVLVCSICDCGLCSLWWEIWQVCFHGTPTPKQQTVAPFP